MFKFKTLIASFILCVAVACQKAPQLTPTLDQEPITFVSPDTTVLTASALSEVPVQLRLLSDRSIDSLVVSLYVDSTLNTFTPPDGLQAFQTIRYDSIKSNRYDFSTMIPLPASAKKGHFVRVLFDLYSQQKEFSKQLKIIVR